jgi:UDP-N-acetylmuramyl pentapeptide phosphotransferase/UDP-N-acetylglucosamine-1-phosphate transferase
MKEGILFISALILILVITPLVRRLSYHIGYLDRPDGDGLKIHGLAIPRSGGVAMFGIFNILLLILFLTESENRDTSHLNPLGRLYLFQGFWHYKSLLSWNRATCLEGGETVGVRNRIIGKFGKI